MGYDWMVRAWVWFGLARKYRDKAARVRGPGGGEERGGRSGPLWSPQKFSSGRAAARRAVRDQRCIRLLRRIASSLAHWAMAEPVS